MNANFILVLLALVLAVISIFVQNRFLVTSAIILICAALLITSFNSPK